MSTKAGKTSQAGPATGIPWMGIIGTAVLLDIGVFCLLVLRWMVFGWAWDSGDSVFRYADVLVLSFLISWKVVGKSPSNFMLNAVLIALFANVFTIGVGAFFIDARTTAFVVLSSVMWLGCIAAARFVRGR